MRDAIKKGTQQFIDEVFVQGSSKATGEGLTGLLFNSADLVDWYMRQGDPMRTQVTLADIPTLGTYVSGGFKEISATNVPGFYAFHPPDAFLADHDHGSVWG